ncbi:MAG: S41 family peptidase [Archangium sp.]|nr:S41 family peptidase [Archangium sp.]
MKRWVMVAACLMGCTKFDPKLPPAPPAPAPAAAESPAIRLMNEWFKAFNADDKEALSAFAVAHDPDMPLDGSFRAMTGGFVVKRMRDLSPTSAEAIVKAQNGGQYARGKIDLDPKDLNRVLKLYFLVVPTPDEFLTPELRKERAIDGSRREETINKIAIALTTSYVDADKAKSMAAALSGHLAAGDYDNIVEGAAFAERLTDDLHADTHDLHVRVMFGPHPRDEPPPQPEGDQLAQLRGMNFGFGPIERMKGNVAHVVINGFPPAEFVAAKKGIGDLMSQAADADALIIDLRNNNGGSPETVALVASYMFADKPVHLIDSYERETNTTRPSWTHAKLAGKRFGGKKPVYVITSKRTFSGGEELAYDLQTTKRATIIGETTRGGAHVTKTVSLDDWFTLAVPHAASISPVTHGNWEGTGVVPDVPTSADAALDEALERALADLKRP